MGFYRKLKYFLVHTRMLSNKRAQELIDTGAVELDGIRIHENCLLHDTAEIKISGEVVREKKEQVYLKFYKPRGFESTLNTSVPDNLSGFFQSYPGLAIAGRLDKDSEGLLLLSNDGQWVEKVCNPKFEKEKEYRVTLDRNPDADFFLRFSQGLRIGAYQTAPCSCEPLEHAVVRIVLKEGKNRQIRRMCRALGYQVTRLVRLRIDTILLGDLLPGSTGNFSSRI